VKELFDCDLAAELSARALYEEAATHCHSVKDYVSRGLFEKLMHDEEEHIDFLETQLDLVAKLGAELYAQHHTKIGTVVPVFSWRGGLPRGPLVVVLVELDADEHLRGGHLL
jgi:Ferritin-like domain